MQTTFYGKIKEGRATKHTLPFNCSDTTQDKTKARKAPIDKDEKHVLTMGRTQVRHLADSIFLNLAIEFVLSSEKIQ